MKIINFDTFKFSFILIFIIAIICFGIVFQSMDSLIVSSDNLVKKSMKLAYEEKQKELKNYTTLAFKTLQSYYERTSHEQLKGEAKEYIKEHTNFLLSIINSEYERYKNVLNEKELKKRLQAIIHDSRYGSSGYFWINDFNYTMVMHPIKEELSGKRFFHTPEIPFVELAVDALKKSGSNQEYIEYKFYNPHTQKTVFKTSLVTHFKPYNWIIGTGAYIDDMSEKIKNEAIEAIARMKYGQRGYFWIIDSSYTLLMDGFKSTFPKKNMVDVHNQKGDFLYRRIVDTAVSTQEGGFVTYEWRIPDKQGEYEKLSFVKRFEPWDLIVGTGTYLMDIESNRVLMNEQQHENRMHLARIIVLFVLLLILIALLYRSYLKQSVAEYKLRKQLLLEQTLLDTVNIPVFYKDTNFKYLGCNKAFEEFTQRKKEEILGKTVFDLFPHTIAQEYHKKDQELLEKKEQQTYEGILKKGTSSLKNIIYNKNVFITESGKTDGIVGSMFDITSLKNKTKALEYLNKNLEEKIKERTHEIHEQKTILQNILEAQSSLLIVTDFQTTYFTNSAFLEFFRIECKEDFIKNYGSLLEVFCEYPGYVHKGCVHNSQESGKELFSVVNALSEEKRVVMLLDKKVEPKAFYIDITQVDEEAMIYLVSLTDITKITIEKNIAEQKAYIDGLTEVPNRNKFELEFNKELHRASRYASSFCLAILDIDYFKKCNDNYGHLIGDEVLIMIAQNCANSIREVDLFARWGGEEFVILMPQVSLEQAVKNAEKLRKMIETLHHKTAGNVTCSFGVTQYAPNDCMSTMLKRCDEALYNAKSAGRNNVQCI